MIHDYLVVGSGASGAHAAQTLIEHGARVAMLDVGISDEKYQKLIPPRDFTSLREQEPDQHRYLIGDRFEGVPWGPVKVGAQLTPPRRFMIQDVERFIPLVSDTFQPFESLAYGGLGNGWGLGCFVFSDAELKQVGLSPTEMQHAYDVIAHRIGISAAHDDGSPYSIGHLTNCQPALKMDSNAKMLHQRYMKKCRKLKERGFVVGQPAMAILSQPLGVRRATAYHDMDFYSDHGMSAYRPWMTVNELRRSDRFRYYSSCLAVRFQEEGDQVCVSVLRTDTQTTQTFYCKRLVLAAGVFGTARIVLRSFRGHSRLPVLCNHYCYMPCLQPAMLGKPAERLKTSMAQLVVYHDPDRMHRDVAVACLFSYRSLLLFRLVKETPFNLPDARAIMQYLQSSLIIAGIHHPDCASDEKYLELVDDPTSPTGDRLHVRYLLSNREMEQTQRREKAFMRAFRALGCYPIKRVYPGYGASIHYSGTLPFSSEPQPLTLNLDGRLHGTKRVFVADGSGFRFLPAKGPTLSLMANAHRVACNAMEKGRT